jgi:hypothetical protein
LNGASAFLYRAHMSSQPSSTQSNPARSRVSIVTPEVERARSELIEAIAVALSRAEMTRTQAEQKLSLLMADLWDRAEEVVSLLPAQRGRFVVAEDKKRRDPGGPW